ncbi:MAG TPA: zf-HC2 domain-containing protein [Gemmatimonadales bacterium]
MTDQWTERLSEYLDGDLSADERVELEAHLPGCPECRTILDDLRAVVVRASQLEDRRPAGDLWPGIAERIGAQTREPARVLSLEAARRVRTPGRLLIGRMQLAAAAAALITVSAGTGWLAGGGIGVPAAAPTSGAEPGLVRPAATFTRPSYDQAIRELSATLEAGSGRLDTVTVRVLRQSLERIDVAIVQARRAVEADPASAYLHTHLAETMRRKLDLLRRAAALASAES